MSLLQVPPAQAEIPGGDPDLAGRIRLDLDIEGTRGSLSDREIRRWVTRTAGTTAEYCGRFPVRSLRVEVRLRGGTRVGFGQHFSGRRVRINVGRNTSPRTLARDFVLLHEMLHTALPSLDRRHRWMREGLSTYLETVVRAQAGAVSDEEVWSLWTRTMANGLPRPGDRGLDRTPTWGRVYWGGALFWLVVDVHLRRTTRGQQTVQTLVQGLVARGGNSRNRWTMARLLREADAVAGNSVVSRVYRNMALSPSAPDLERLYRRLGVEQFGSQIRFRQSAPWSRIRRGLTNS